MRGRLVLGILALAVGCTTPYRIDAGSRVDGGRFDAGLDGSVVLDGGPDSPDSPDAFTCIPSCTTASQLSPCVGADAIDCELGCIGGPPAHCGVMVVANVEDALAATPPHGDVVASNGVIETGACAWPTLLAPIMGRLVDLDGGRVCLFVFASLTIPAGVEVRAEGPYPLIVVSEGEVQILGDLSVDSRRAGSGSASSETLGAGSGTGGVPGEAGMVAGSGTAGGGGGGGFATAGGAGGMPASGGAGGLGGLGASYPLEPLIGGSRGGAGGSLIVASAAVGGPGGGAMQISSRLRIVASGYLGASGGGGARGPSDTRGGAGGGSGGAILLEAPEILVTGEVNVSGGGGGTGGCVFGTAGSGSDGAHQTSAPSGGAPCAITAGAGARGAGGGSPLGADATGSGNNGGSGGGGGAGVVRFRVYEPLVLPGAARLNPRLSPGLYTIDPLAIR